MILRDLIATSKKQNQKVSLYSKKGKDSNQSSYLGSTKSFSKIFDFIGHLEVIDWETDNDYMVVYVLIQEDGGSEDAE